LQAQSLEPIAFSEFRGVHVVKLDEVVESGRTLQLSFVAGSAVVKM
jgi:hypothetical protein